ncbi:hypothetical protein NXG27_09075 [Megasphaera paucivorans]|uniref:Uncharacterized protein n=1 Tax=Megasphaera paucivorans TaxID=349095 RepID=A0A1G9VVJ4_9FIRM|nr:hypothetical protein [Megasphaera paucivorans]SDM75887.1 hypothetical protein SAMN05660299_01478 [Megasphaera paucivorans]
MKRSRRILGAALLIGSFYTAAAWAASDEPDSIIIRKHPMPIEQTVGKTAGKTTTTATTQADDTTKTTGTPRNSTAKNDAAKDANLAKPEGKDRYEEEVIPNPKLSDMAVIPLYIIPLTEKDFTIGGLGAGDMMTKVRRVLGSPERYLVSEHYTTLRYNDDTQKLRVVLRNDTIDMLKEPNEQGNRVQVGVNSIFLAQGTNIAAGRDIHLGYPVESVIRRYGAPTNILRDTDSNIYYMVYESPRKDTMLVFAIYNRKVERIALMPPRTPYIDPPSETLPINAMFAPRDFSLMGFSLEDPFEANKYNMWTNMITNKGNKFWIYGDYGVEIDRHNTIKRVFLMTNNAYTNRGATLGYHVSTILGLYGLPQRLEKGSDGSKSVDGYFYDNPYQKGTSLLFVVDHAQNYVEDVLLLNTPIEDLQNPKKRYGLEA